MKLTLITLIAFFMTASVVHAAGDPARGNELRHECIDCHGEDGMGDEEYPRIAGLDEDYLMEQLMAFKNGERPNRAGMMLWTLEDLDAQDLADLAAYYALQSGD
jgi:cytochrome c553